MVRVLLACTLLHIVHESLSSSILPTVDPWLRTDVLIKYEDAPSSPDADDPAIYVSSSQTLVLGTAKNAGLGVWDTNGRLIQWITPRNHPPVREDDPPTPVGVTEDDIPCEGSWGSNLYSRFNGVSILYGIEIEAGLKVDVAVVTDRRCDRLRFFFIDPDNTKPLSPASHDDLPRIFPNRIHKPSPLKPAEEEGIFENPLEDQNTGYGVTTYVDGAGAVFVFATQLFRSTIAQLRIIVHDGKITYENERTIHFSLLHTLRYDNGDDYKWYPCVEDPEKEEPFAEGIVAHSSGVLYVGFETVGVFKLDLNELDTEESVVNIGQESLIVKVTDYGRSYAAIPDGDEYKCRYGAERSIINSSSEGTIFVAGCEQNVGKYLKRDVEGMAIAGDKYLIVSSQGDSSYHIFENSDSNSYVGGFTVEGVRNTDGIDVVTDGVDERYDSGLLVLHNGDAEIRDDIRSVISSHELAGATEFVYIHWDSVLDALDSQLQ